MPQMQAKAERGIPVSESQLSSNEITAAGPGTVPVRKCRLMERAWKKRSMDLPESII